MTVLVYSDLNWSSWKGLQWRACSGSLCQCDFQRY